MLHRYVPFWWPETLTTSSVSPFTLITVLPFQPVSFISPVVVPFSCIETIRFFHSFSNTKRFNVTFFLSSNNSLNTQQQNFNWSICTKFWNYGALVQCGDWETAAHRPDLAANLWKVKFYWHRDLSIRLHVVYGCLGTAMQRWVVTVKTMWIKSSQLFTSSPFIEDVAHL